MWINGRRFIARGGNWGFSESMLRYRAREYETAMRYHRDLHFDMIRNWVGMTGRRSFLRCGRPQRCRHLAGFLARQSLGRSQPRRQRPLPDQREGLSPPHSQPRLARALLRPQRGLSRRSPSTTACARCVATLEPNSHYISSSADGPVSGHGPYRVEPLRYYFDHAPVKFHSEMGAPNVPEMETLRRTMPESAMWPQGYQWPLHDYFIRSMYPGIPLPAQRNRRRIRRRNEHRRLARARAVRRLQRLSRHVRGPEQKPPRPAHLDEPSRVAFHCCGKPTTISSTPTPATSARRRAPSRCTSSGMPRPMPSKW